MRPESTISTASSSLPSNTTDDKFNKKSTDNSDKMKITFSIAIVLLIGALVAVDAKDIDMSKELSELLHRSETDEKVLAEGDDGELDEEDADALAKVMMDGIMESVMQSDGEDDGEGNLLASLMADDSNEKEVAARLQFLGHIFKKIRRGIRRTIRGGRRIFHHGRRLFIRGRKIARRVCRFIG